MSFNDYLGPLVNVEGATSINTILLVDVDVESFSPYKYVPTSWVKHTKTTIRGAPSLENPSCSKSDFSHLLSPSPSPSPSFSPSPAVTVDPPLRRSTASLLSVRNSASSTFRFLIQLRHYHCADLMVRLKLQRVCDRRPWLQPTYCFPALETCSAFCPLSSYCNICKPSSK